MQVHLYGSGATIENKSSIAEKYCMASSATVRGLKCLELETGASSNLTDVEATTVNVGACCKIINPNVITFNAGACSEFSGGVIDAVDAGASCVFKNIKVKTLACGEDPSIESSEIDSLTFGIDGGKETTLNTSKIDYIQIKEFDENPLGNRSGRVNRNINVTVFSNGDVYYGNTVTHINICSCCKKIWQCIKQFFLWLFCVKSHNTQSQREAESVKQTVQKGPRVLRLVDTSVNEVVFHGKEKGLIILEGTSKEPRCKNGDIKDNRVNIQA